MTKLRVLLAGLGVRGRHWAEVLVRSPRCEIVAYADPNPEAVSKAQSQYGNHPGFDTVENALAVLPEVDALILANPPIGREKQLHAACARKIPVLVEKPLALSVHEATQLVEMAETAGIPLMVGLNFRYLGVTIETMRILREGLVGKAEFGRFTYERYRDGNRPDLNKYPLTMDQPMLWEQSIHHFDLMRYIYDQEPVLVQAVTWNPSWSMYKSDANVAALFTFEDGLLVNYQGTWQSGWAEPRFEWRTDCTNGILSQQHQFGELHYARRMDSALTPVNLPPHEQWITETARLLDAFVKTLLEGAPLECSGRDHLMSLTMVEACKTSSQESRAVPIAGIPPFDDGVHDHIL